MRAPAFWSRPGSLLSRLLVPAGWTLAAAAQVRRVATTPHRCQVPVICIGNLVAGGAGKTPTALAVLRHLKKKGWSPHALTRGYGGAQSGPLRVTSGHTFADVGDEALLLAATAPTWVAHDRVAGAEAAVAAGAEAVVMDDGFQNPSLGQDLSILVVDGGYGLGNGRLLPAGPLREPPQLALRRASAVVFVADDGGNVIRPDDITTALPLHIARLVPTASIVTLAGQDVVAFAGIGRPRKFFNTLDAAGCRLAGAFAFPDHHAYRDYEIMELIEKAVARGAKVVTTAKDAVRLPRDARAMVEVLEVELRFDDPDALDRLLAPLAGLDRRR
jgi:tetraacyldisaccharide 4'-kinase